MNSINAIEYAEGTRIFQTGIWVECAKCRALMYDTFDTCWSCKAPMDSVNKVPVDF